MSWVNRTFGVGLVVAGGCYASHDVDSAVPRACDDADGDGYGEGADCRGPDCDDGDETRHDDCLPCEGSEREACYGGPDGTQNVGACRAGMRRCLAGEWSPCEDQTLPSAEHCNSVDDDCNGVIDDGVLSGCGDCRSNCQSACAGVDCHEELVAASGGVRRE